MISYKTRGLYYAKLMRFDRPAGTFLLLWSTLWALALATQGRFPPFYTMLFVLAVVIMRAAGSVINDYADYHYDAQVWRTCERPLAAGLVSKKEALVLFTILLGLAFILLLFLNTFCFYLACAAVVLIIFYPFTKRFFLCPQLILSIVWSWNILIVFAALQNALPPLAWILFLANASFTMAYDTIYALCDRKEDLKMGLHSSAILFGQADKILIAFFQGLTLLCLFFVGQMAHLAWPYYASLILALIFFIYQQHLIVEREPRMCLRAFLTNQWVGLVIFLGMII